MIDPARLRGAYETARTDLLAERDPSGHWIGELSGSALSTATATSALAVVLRNDRGDVAAGSPLEGLIARGLDYLARSQNPDGGWGDTDKSHSNIATTMLARAAFHLAGAADRHAGLLQSAQKCIERQGGLPGLRRRYGRDKTFAVPILTNCALAGLVPWRDVSPLPFELACLPHAVYRFLRLPVVSYAIPALVAIGQARHFHRKPLNPIARLVRRLAVGGSLKVLQRMQPASGGFLEATPLTSFVVMSLAGSGRVGHPVVRRGVEFLVRSVRDDGSWPIDTNLATWVTTLASNALAGAGEDVGRLACLDWLLSCQHRDVHPYTNAAPGGWGWTGAVPDADDTAGALLALAAFAASDRSPDVKPLQHAAIMGITWLFGLQNKDGGWPTFCRGWGKLPFDRSGVDLTAHVLRAFHAWRAHLPAWIDETCAVRFSGRTVSALVGERLDRATRRGLDYLAREQRPDGSWAPLWFGNQDHPDEENPVYGTARVLLAYWDLGRMHENPPRRGAEWLVAAQNPDGGWGGSGAGIAGSAQGGVSSVEETAVAVEALISAVADAGEGSAGSFVVPRFIGATCGDAAKDRRNAVTTNGPGAIGQRLADAAGRGLDWLVAAVESGRHREPSPIGFYFAKLWYYEKLYPLVFTVSALGRAVGRGCPESSP
jgi:squalene-hopene/tetraprenyl-beta-curcumene cyclase